MTARPGTGHRRVRDDVGRPQARTPNPFPQRHARGVTGTLIPDMSRSTALPAPRRAGRLGAAMVALMLALAACGSAIPVTSFDPSSPCTTDGRQPGAYPGLEALLPTAYEGAAPMNVDSGRSCTAAALGTLSTIGIRELHYAGATWDLGGPAALTVAVFTADGLTPGAMIDFYAAGAKGNSKVEKAQLSDATVGGRPARRLDVLQTDGTGQTIVAWPSAQAGLVHVLLASDLGDAKVLDALATFGTP